MLKTYALIPILALATTVSLSTPRLAIAGGFEVGRGPEIDTRPGISGSDIDRFTLDSDRPTAIDPAPFGGGDDKAIVEQYPHACLKKYDADNRCIECCD
jgi:hypothetical protein